MSFKLNLIVVFLSLLLTAFAKTSHAIVLTVTQTPGGPGKNYTLSWTAATLSTTTAVTTYFIYEQFGETAVTEVPANLIKYHENRNNICRK